MESILERVFKLRSRGTTLRNEVTGGITTFMTMAYVLFVNAGLLGSVTDRLGNKLPFAQVLTVTALSAAIATAAMGLYANHPFALAAGMGLNAVVAFQLVAVQGLTWPEAMGVVVVEGVAITVLVLTGFREAVMHAIPLALKQAIGVGIGLFIAFIGFVTSGFVGKPAAPELRVELGKGGEIIGAPMGVFVVGLFLTGYLVARRVRGALLIGILVSTVLAIVVNEIMGGKAWGADSAVARIPLQLVAVPTSENFSLVGAFSFDFFRTMGVLGACLAVFTIMLGDFFDTMGTVIGLGTRAGFLDEEGRLPRANRVLLVDSLAAVLGGAFSASSNTTYIESASGIEEGGRTGLTSVVTALLFLLSIFLWPMADVVPSQATGPALVVVGFLMMPMVRSIPWDDGDVAFPAFLTMVMMPFTYSITNGIGAGFVAFTVIKLLRGKVREVHPMMAASAVAFVLYFGMHYVRIAVGLAA
ncbi:MAG: NCS2 family permease [Myxococcota bacterium]